MRDYLTDGWVRTVQGLAHLLDRDPEDVLKEALADETVFVLSAFRFQGKFQIRIKNPYNYLVVKA